ncbi:hypothetical protein [Nocardia paucivorans]|uniref:hypothetical protein n=1 Tax=Nocardia paucivorans TaxID=114259 RepID=UPI0012FA2A70|nr:hypothetical protein [Nocardia paucivorans]
MIPVAARSGAAAVGTQTSYDSVTVTIDSNGVPTAIRFTEGIRRKSPTALFSAVRHCSPQ